MSALTVPTDELRRISTAAAGVVTSVHPWAEVAAQDGELRVRAIGPELELTTSFAHMDEIDPLWVDARTLAAVLRKAPNGEVKLEPADGALEIRSGTFAARLARVADDPLPPHTAPPTGTEIDLAPLILAATIASTQTERPLLTGIAVGPEGVAATDSYKAIEIPAEIGIDEELLVPRGAIKLAESIGMELARVAVNGSRLLIADDEAQIVSRTLDGRFPAIKQLFPEPVAEPLRCRAEDLADALDRLSPLMNSLTQVDLTCEGSQLVLTVEGGRDEIAVEGAAIEQTRFNLTHLLTVARCFEGEVELHTASPIRPLTIQGKEAHRCLLMPQRIP